jgi:hypothetical protein
MSDIRQGSLDPSADQEKGSIFKVTPRGKSLCPKYETTRLINQVLSHFKTTRGKVVKMEYLRAHIIRLFRKAIRRQIKGKTTFKNFLKRKQSQPAQFHQSVSAIKECIHSNLSFFQPISLPRNGPASDGKLSKQTKKEKTFKTYNNAFVKNFFNREEIRKCFFYFIQLIYTGNDLEGLQEVLKIKCCSGNHQDACTRAWYQLKSILQFDLFNNIGLESWKPALEDSLLLDSTVNSLDQLLDLNEFDFLDEKF